jgi:CheY-like chemotaxis protein/HPt (histidine-containing phosphotransfer) domain-containing protein
MDHPDLPAGAHILVFAATGDGEAERLSAVLVESGLVIHPVALLSHGLGRLLRPPPGTPSITAVAVVGGTTGLGCAAIARAVRTLPGHERMPMILVGDPPTDRLSRCLLLPLPLDADRLRERLAEAADNWGDVRPTTVVKPVPILSPLPHATDPIRKRILVVDDNEVNRLVIGRLVTALGHDARVVDSGAAALTHLAAEAVDLLLTDCQMPDMDGYELTRAIRRGEIGSGQHLPIVAVTAHAQTADRQRCLDAGMDDYLTKPINGERLHATIRHWLPDTGITPNTPRPISDTAVMPVLFDPRPLRLIDSHAPGTAASILDTFGEDLDRFIATAPDLLRDNARDALARMAHKIKGASGSIGALQFFTACADLENDARTPDRTICAARLEAALAAARALREYLAGLTWPL